MKVSGLFGHCERDLNVFLSSKCIIPGYSFTPTLFNPDSEIFQIDLNKKTSAIEHSLKEAETLSGKGGDVSLEE